MASGRGGSFASLHAMCCGFVLVCFVLVVVVFLCCVGAWVLFSCSCSCSSFFGFIVIVLLLSRSLTHLNTAGRLLEQADGEHRVVGDLGYRGLYGVATSAFRRKTRSVELQRLEGERTQCHEFQTDRAAIEQVNSQVKQWAVFRERWRGAYPKTNAIEPCVRAIIALTQIIMLGAPLHKAR